MSIEFNNIFRQLKSEKTGEVYTEDTSTPEPTPILVPPKKSYLTLILLFFSLTLNVFFVYIVKESLAMYASPEHTLYKRRVTPADSFIDDAMYERAYRRVCGD